MDAWNHEGSSSLAVDLSVKRGLVTTGSPPPGHPLSLLGPCLARQDGPTSWFEHRKHTRSEQITLLWESSDGEPTTRNLLFVWRGRAEPEKDARGRKRYETDDRNGFHALRHYRECSAPEGDAADDPPQRCSATVRSRRRPTTTPT
jgi:hypothetical protein